MSDQRCKSDKKLSSNKRKRPREKDCDETAPCSEGLFSSIFGSDSNSSDLFSTSKAKEWEQRSNDLREKNEIFHGEKMSRNEIISARRKVVARSAALVNSVTVIIPKPEELRLFTILCEDVFRKKGIVVMKHGQSTILPKETLQALEKRASSIEREICSRLDKKGIVWEVKSDDVLDQKSLEIEKQHSFHYHEVASRCLGRLDIRHGMDQKPFSQKDVIKNQFLMPVIEAVLGKNCKLVYSGLILSFKNSADQPWHQDGDKLFQKNEFPDGNEIHLPPYALNVFIPLHDVELEVGPTEFCVGSHITSESQDALKTLLYDSYENDKVINPLLDFGDALIYDYRICHRGTRNLTEMNKTRSMLYLMYAKPWFHEHLNFGQRRLFD